MEVPQLPTDNLYKFIAIGGLVVALASLLVPIRESWMLEREIARSSARLETAETELSLIAPGQERVTELVEMVQASGDTVADSVVDAWWAKVDSISSKWDETPRSTWREVFDRYSKIAATNEEQRVAALQAKRLSDLGAFWFWVGLIITVSGFALWYFRVQRYQDAILRKQSKRDE